MIEVIDLQGDLRALMTLVGSCIGIAIITIYSYNKIPNKFMSKLSEIISVVAVILSIIFGFALLMATMLGEFDDNYKITGEVQETTLGFIKVEGSEMLISNSNGFIREGDTVVADQCSPTNNYYDCESIEVTK